MTMVKSCYAYKAILWIFLNVNLILGITIVGTLVKYYIFGGIRCYNIERLSLKYNILVSHSAGNQTSLKRLGRFL